MGTFDTLLFRCAICQHDVRDFPNRNGRDRHLSPICRGCERGWSERIGKPTSGAMMDRRKTMQVVALSEALRSEASAIEWRHKYASA